MTDQSTPTANLTRSICVIIPCHNTSSAHLEMAVQSVIAERKRLEAIGASVECVIVDDASDRVETCVRLGGLENVHDWLRIIRFNQKSGSSCARNAGIESTSAAWLAFLDSDDYWLPNGIARLFSAVLTDAEIDWISGDFYYQFGEQAPENTSFFSSHPSRASHVKSALQTENVLVLKNPVHAFMDGNICSMGSCLMKRDLVRNVGGFDTTLAKGDDTELYWRLARSCTFAFAPWPIFVYRRHSGSLTGDGGILTEWEPSVIQRMLANPDWNQHSEVLRRRLMKAFDSNIFYYRKRRQRRLALATIYQALRLDVFRPKTWRHLLGTLTFG